MEKQEYTDLVNQIWDATGIKTYEGTRGRSLPEIVAELKRKADRYDAIIAEARREPLRRGKCAP
jgi:hypothetical protein